MIFIWKKIILITTSAIVIYLFVQGYYFFEGLPEVHNKSTGFAKKYVENRIGIKQSNLEVIKHDYLIMGLYEVVLMDKETKMKYDVLIRYDNDYSYPMFMMLNGG